MIIELINSIPTIYQGIIIGAAGMLIIWLVNNIIKKKRNQSDISIKALRTITENMHRKVKELNEDLRLLHGFFVKLDSSEGT
ncbi:MAG TPA: hypothetical protein ENG87_02485 [Candidatus Pacearchaeota archaeon]|nr:hypothetical protein BMS3Abin17_00618 [archaeon BMS3Abin17]HDK42222.1 hypothetical protein [Candidatus Pacearchaeota archaeon]HDZ60187.1 hypothetical protein [Candidatus Pacearchaeota archaeon]